jgi:hypothetical protein
VNLALIATVAPIIFIAELPDKTALASLVLGARYRASWVFSGVAAAFAADTLNFLDSDLLTFITKRITVGSAPFFCHWEVGQCGPLRPLLFLGARASVRAGPDQCRPWSLPYC